MNDETNGKKRRSPKRRPLFLLGVRAYAEDGAELPAASYTCDTVTRDSAAVLDMVTANPGMPYIRIDANKVD